VLPAKLANTVYVPAADGAVDVPVPVTLVPE